MLDHATNELLTRVGPNTPCGGYLPMSCEPDPTFRQNREFSDIFDDSHLEYEIPATSPAMSS